MSEAIEKMFEKYSDDYLDFEKIEIKLNNRPDLHAFILLDSIFPSVKDIVANASHDEICLSISYEEIKTLKETHILELTRCGVRFNDDYLCMFA